MGDHLQIPSKVKNLVIFEDCHGFYGLQFDNRPVAGPFYPSFHRNGRHVARSLVSQSTSMETVAVSFLVMADVFFKSTTRTTTWPHLRSLALTSPTLCRERIPHMESLLCSAADLHIKMPELCTFVIWNGERDNASAFMYERSGKERATITWRANWAYSVTPYVSESWCRKTKSLGINLLEFKNEGIGAEIHSHGDAIHHHKLPCPVVTPESLWQIRREAYPD